MNTRPPLEHDLHAYADRRLDPAQLAAVEAWLGSHEEEAERLHDWQHQNEVLHRCFDPVLDEPLPTRLIRAARGARDVRPYLRVAAAVGWLVLGILVGLGMPRLISHDSPVFAAFLQAESTALPLPARFSRQAALAHAVYAVELRHPVEVTRDQEAHLVQWLSKRTGVALQVPDLNALGFSLMGGRLLPGEEGPTAQFMYEDTRQRRITLYLGRDRSSAGDVPLPAFGYAGEQGTNVFFWTDGDVNYALSGNLERAALLDLSQLAYRQMASAR